MKIAEGSKEDPMSIHYSNILSRAWNITWKYKILWFFGFLAMLGGGGGSGGFSPQTSYQFSGTDNANPPREWRNVGNTANLPPEWRNFIDQISRIDINTWITVAVGIVCCLFLLGIALWLLSIVGRGGLIGGIVKADATGSVSFREAWGMGRRYFWRLLLVRLLAIVVGLVAAVVIILPGIFIGILTCGLGFIPLICVVFIAGVVIRVWFLLMDYAVVMENQGVGEAIGRAWTVLGEHIGPIIIFYIILFAISLGIGIVMLFLFAPPALVIFLSLLPLLTATAGLNVPLLVAGIVLLVFYIIGSLVVRAIWTVWEAGVWALAYQAFIGGQQSAIVAGVNPPPVASPTP
jgi:flagellar biosynthesis protein FliQ